MTSTGEEMYGYRIEGRRPVGQRRRTWLESVDMSELAIDRENDHDRKK